MTIAKRLPYFGTGLSLLKNPLKTLVDASKDGDVVQLKVPGVKLFLLHNPEHVKHVLANDDIYIKGDLADPFKKLFGTSVLTTEGAEWKAHRLIVQPAFHRQNLHYFATIFRDETLRMLDRWATLPAGQPEIDCAKEMKYVTQSIIIKTLFGTDIQDIKQDDIDHALDNIFGSFFHGVVSSGIPVLLQRLIPGMYGRVQRFNQGMSDLHAIIAKLIQIKRSQSAGRYDLLDMLLHAHFEDGSAVTHEQITDEVITFFVAGHETTSVVLSAACLHLATNPAIAAKIYQEIDQIDHPLSFDDLPNLTYTRSVFNEALRIYPPGWFIPRRAKSHTVIAGTAIPADSIMILSPYLVHRHPAFWSNPDVFDPERFRDNLRNPEHFYPFGYGGRQCIAKEFALMEGPLILGNVAKRYRFQMKYPDLVEPYSGMTLNLKQKNREGLKMLVYKR